jgi:hypothetical protein
MLNKMSEDIDDICPECGIEGEDITHLFRCNSAKRNKIKQNMFDALQAHMLKTATPQHLSQSIIYQLRQWFQIPLADEDTPDVPGNEIDSLLQNALSEQNAIGWDQFLLGRISKKWGEIINMSENKNTEAQNGHQQRNQQRNVTAESWGVKVLTIIWTHLLEIWSARNSCVHGDTKEEQHTILKQKLLKRVEKLKEKSTKLQDTSITYFKTPTEIISRMTMQQIIAWIRHSEIIIAAQQKKEKTIALGMNEPGYLVPLTRRRGVESGLRISPHDSGTRNVS